MQRLPSLFRVNPDGKEATSNYSVHGDTMIATGTAQLWRVRDGQTSPRYSISASTRSAKPQGTGNGHPAYDAPHCEAPMAVNGTVAAGAFRRLRARRSAVHARAIDTRPLCFCRRARVRARHVVEQRPNTRAARGHGGYGPNLAFERPAEPRPVSRTIADADGRTHARAAAAPGHGQRCARLANAVLS